MIQVKCRKSRALSLWAAPLLLSGVFLAALFSPQVEARGHFGGGGAHFNVGGHFNAVRPMPGGGFHGEFARGTLSGDFLATHRFIQFARDTIIHPTPTLASAPLALSRPGLLGCDRSGRWWLVVHPATQLCQGDDRQCDL